MGGNFTHSTQFRGWKFSNKHKEKVQKYVNEVNENLEDKIDEVSHDAEKKKFDNSVTVIHSSETGKKKFTSTEIPQLGPQKMTRTQNTIVIDLTGEDSDEEFRTKQSYEYVNQNKLKKKKKKQSESSDQNIVVAQEKDGTQLESSLRFATNPKMLEDLYFVSKKGYRKFQRQTIGEVGWLLYLRKMFPDMCVVYDRVNDVAPFHYNFERITHKDFRMVEHRNLKKGEKPIIKRSFVLTKNRRTGKLTAQCFRAAEGFEYIVTKDHFPKKGLNVAPWVPKMFRKCVKNKNIRFTAFMLRQGTKQLAHANALMFDNRSRILYRFEAHGSSGQNSAKIDKEIRDYISHNPTMKKYINRYEGPVDFCPVLGPQARTAAHRRVAHTEGKRFPSGFCIPWSLYFFHIVINNPNVPIPTLMQRLDELDDKVLHDMIIDYTGFMGRLKAELDDLYKSRPYPSNYVREEFISTEEARRINSSEELFRLYESYKSKKP